LRGIDESLVIEILKAPERIIKENRCNTIFQSVIPDENGKKYLFRIFVNDCKQPNLIVTAYRTSKIDKYHEDKIR
jgi:hypothetical protein